MNQPSNIRQEFLDTYHLQGKIVQKVFKYLSWLARKFDKVFVLRSTIAKWVTVCVRSIGRALDKLVELGWINIYHRHRQSSLYFINDALKDIDVSNKKTWAKTAFTEEKCPPNVPPSPKSFSRNNKSYTGSGNDGFDNHQKELHLPQCVKIKGLELWQQTLLAKKFAEGQLVHAIDNAKNFVKRGGKIDNFLGFLYNAAKNAYEPKPWQV